LRVVPIIISGGRFLKMNVQHDTKQRMIFVDLLVKVNQLSILIEVDYQRLQTDSMEFQLNRVISEARINTEIVTYSQPLDLMYCRESVRHYRLAS
jgi:hypothetical protein